MFARARHERRADQAAERPDVHLFLVAIEPVRHQGMGQLVHGRAPAAAARPSTSSPGAARRFRLYASDTAVVTSWNTTKRTSVMCTRTVVPNHRPRLIGDQVRKSVMVSTRGRLITPRDIAAVSLESNLTASPSARNATRRRPRTTAAAQAHSRAVPGERSALLLKYRLARRRPFRVVSRAAAMDPSPISPEKHVRVELGPRSYDIQVDTRSAARFGPFVRQALDATWTGSSCRNALIVTDGHLAELSVPAAYRPRSSRAASRPRSSCRSTG